MNRRRAAILTRRFTAGRRIGDYGIVNGSNTPYPTFYAEKLLQYFARPGDSVLNGTSDNLLLSAYAVHRTNGALTLLVINKDMTTNLNAQIALTNFVPWTTATIQSYGIPQDQAAETNAAAVTARHRDDELSNGRHELHLFVSTIIADAFHVCTGTLGAFRVGRPARTGGASPARPTRHALCHSKFAGFGGVDLRLHQHARWEHFEHHQPGFSEFPAPVLPRCLAALKNRQKKLFAPKWLRRIGQVSQLRILNPRKCRASDMNSSKMISVFGVTLDDAKRGALGLRDTLLHKEFAEAHNLDLATIPDQARRFRRWIAKSAVNINHLNEKKWRG